MANTLFSALLCGALFLASSRAWAEGEGLTIRAQLGTAKTDGDLFKNDDQSSIYAVSFAGFLPRPPKSMFPGGSDTYIDIDVGQTKFKAQDDSKFPFKSEYGDVSIWFGCASVGMTFLTDYWVRPGLQFGWQLLQVTQGSHSAQQYAAESLEGLVWAGPPKGGFAASVSYRKIEVPQIVDGQKSGFAIASIMGGLGWSLR